MNYSPNSCERPRPFEQGPFDPELPDDGTPDDRVMVGRRREGIARRWYDEFRRTLKPLEMEEWFDLFVCRPLAFVVAKLLRLTPITPDQVSFLGLAWAIFVGYCFWIGTPHAFLLGAFGYFLWNVLDCVDGQLARMRGGGSPIGHIVDAMVDQFATGATFVGLAHGLSVMRPGEHNWWLIATVSGLAMLVECGLLEAKRHEWMSRVYGSRKSFVEDLEQVTALAKQWRKQGKHPVGRALIHYYRFMRLLQNLVHPTSREEPVYSAEENARWAKYNRKVLRMAVWLGPTNQMMVACGCILLGRVDYYFWSTIFVGLPWMGLTYIVAWYAKYQEDHEVLQEI